MRFNSFWCIFSCPWAASTASLCSSALTPPHSFLFCLCLFCIESRRTPYSRALFVIFHPFFVNSRQNGTKKHILKGAAAKFRKNIVIVICKIAPQIHLYHQKGKNSSKKIKIALFKPLLESKNRKIEHFPRLYIRKRTFLSPFARFLDDFTCFWAFSANRTA